jgi:hypothetical protein
VKHPHPSSLTAEQALEAYAKLWKEMHGDLHPPRYPRTARIRCSVVLQIRGRWRMTSEERLIDLDQHTEGLTPPKMIGKEICYLGASMAAHIQSMIES